MVTRMMQVLRRSVLSLGLCLAALATLTPTSCALYREDRCFAEDYEYESAREIFAETGSMDLVRRRMEEIGWRRCLQNEITYRLTKEFEVPAQ